MATFPANPTLLDEFDDAHFGKDVVPGKITVKPCGALAGALDLTLAGQTLELRCDNTTIADIELPFTLPAVIQRCYKKCPDPLTQPHAGQSVRNNPQFVDTMDDKLVFLDDDGSLSFYTASTRALASNPTWSILTGGGTLNNVPVKTAIDDGRIVAFEDNYIILTEAATGTWEFYSASTGAFDSFWSVAYSATVFAGGPLAGLTLRNATANLIAGWKYLGQLGLHAVYYQAANGRFASYFFNNSLLYDATWSMGGANNTSLVGGPFQGLLSTAMPNFLGIHDDRISFVNPANGNIVSYSMSTRNLVSDTLAQPLLPLCQTAECSGDSCILGTGAIVTRASLISQAFVLTACPDAPPASGGGSTDSQTLAIAGQNLSITGGNTIVLPAAATPTVTLTTAGTGAARTITPVVNGTAGTALAFPDSDAQALAIAGNAISISGGNTINLPATTVANSVANGPTSDTITTTVNGVAAAPIVIPKADFFRSGTGAGSLPDGTADHTKPIHHNGLFGIGVGLPAYPLHVSNSYTNVGGDTLPTAQHRNGAVVWLSSTVPNQHQFCGVGLVDANQPFWNRIQTQNIAGGHRFFGAVDANSSKQMASIADRRVIFGEPNAPIGEGHIEFRTQGDDAFMGFRSPNASAGGSKEQCGLVFDAYSGNGGISGGSVYVRTAALVAGSTIRNCALFQHNSDVIIGGSTVAYDDDTVTNTLLSVTGAIRLNGGPILPGTPRQNGGLIFGGGGTNVANTFSGTGDSDGGITSLADGQLNFFTNGVETGRVALNVWSKAGGGAWAVLSDRRTKRNIQPYSQGLEDLLKLNVVQFEYNGLGLSLDDGRTYAGLIADEVEVLQPSWVSELDGEVEGLDPLDPLKQLDPSDATWLLVKAVQELSSKVSELESRLGN